MLNVENFHLNPSDIEWVKTNKKIEYANLPCALDIETTSAVISGTKAAFMYIFMVGFGHGEPVYFGREWSELANLLDKVTELLELNENRRLVMYVHNLAYEFQFIRNYFEWSDVFSLSERKPIRALTTNGIEFRCSYVLSGYTLENTAKNLTKYKVKKMVGDLDYSLPRHSKTPLTEKELGYCENDILVVNSYIMEQIEIYGDVAKIPMTNTGRVRKYVRDSCYYTSKSHKKSSKKKYITYRKLMNDLQISLPTYIQMKRAFMGGFTHANPIYSGEVMGDVSGIDFTSSYPSVMVAEKFPMSKFVDIEVKDVAELDKMAKVFALVMDIKLIGVRAKITHESYLSSNKCYSVKEATINNGRIFEASELITTMTEVDYEILKQVYEWDDIQVSNVKRAFKKHLPKPIIESILKLYGDKTTLKGVEGEEVEYLLSKGMLNSIYGMSVTSVIKNNAQYDSDGWHVETPDALQEIENYNSAVTRFLYYPWGVWVTAYARRNLWSGILATGDDYIYSDTDSLKITNYGNHVDYIDWFNKSIVAKMEKCLSEYNLPFELLHPKTIKGEVKTMGVWDFEGTYSRFKTLGAKRYLYEENGKLHLTVAGLSKVNGLNYMLSSCEGDNSKVFNMFSDGLYIPRNETGKMTHTYIDEPLEFEIKDYKGILCKVDVLSGVHLEPCDFSLSVSSEYSNFLSEFKNGYLVKKGDLL